MDFCWQQTQLDSITCFVFIFPFLSPPVFSFKKKRGGSLLISYLQRLFLTYGAAILAAHSVCSHLRQSSSLHPRQCSSAGRNRESGPRCKGLCQSGSWRGALEVSAEPTYSIWVLPELTDEARNENKSENIPEQKTEQNDYSILSDSNSAR